jgi:hypothetical protein
VRRNVEKGLEHYVMTTWHDDEPKSTIDNHQSNVAASLISAL